MTRESDVDIEGVAEVFKILGDPTRLRILLACLERPLSVGEIANETGASQSLVSHHLQLLRSARLVRGEREARQVIYHAADQHIRHMIADVLAHSAEEP